MTVKEIKEYKGDRTTDLARDLSSFETNFILISGALLAFSITFIKDIVKIQDAGLLWFLFLGWALLAAAMGIMMFAWLYSSNASHELWKIADAFMIKEKLFKDETELTNGQVEDLKKAINDYFLSVKAKLKWMRYIAVSVFLSGLIAFSLFVGTNLLKENKSTVPAAADSRLLIFGKDSLKINAADTILIIKHK